MLERAGYGKTELNLKLSVSDRRSHFYAQVQCRSFCLIDRLFHTVVVSCGLGRSKGGNWFLRIYQTYIREMSDRARRFFAQRECKILG